MNLTEVKELLAKVAAVDNRDLSEITAKAWYEVIGGLSFRVADRALVLARRDARINWLEPKHIIEKSRDAIAELNREETAKQEPEEGAWQACSKPTNFDEMCEFYRKLWEVAPWDRYVQTGGFTAGTSYSKPQRIETRVSATELDRRIRESAKKVGWTVPEPRWD
jgi:hypothetical protein